jgi:hypothetical protein
VPLPADRVRASVVDGFPLPDGTPFRPYETALVEQPVPFETAPGGGTAVLRTHAPCRVEVHAHAPDGGFLVLGDVNYPGWRAAIDGRPAQVYQTDYVLRGVAVPPGDHVVTFRFRPTSFYLGLGLSGASALLLLAFALKPRLNGGGDAPHVPAGPRLGRPGGFAAAADPADRLPERRQPQLADPGRAALSRPEPE